MDGGPAVPLRFLVRVDDFPSTESWTSPQRCGLDAFRAFHNRMRSAGVPYALAVTPQVARDPLDPAGSETRRMTADETAVLAQATAEGVTPALHGLDHRTRLASRRRRSELAGLDADALASRLDRALELLSEDGFAPRIFVPPFNDFDALQYGVLATRFDIVCGGPETVATMGFQPTPQWREGAAYVPAYPPLYGRAEDIVAAAQELVTRGRGGWVPLVLHWTWESFDDWRGLDRLLPVIAGHAARWDDFGTAIQQVA